MTIHNVINTDYLIRFYFSLPTTGNWINNGLKTNKVRGNYQDHVTNPRINSPILPISSLSINHSKPSHDNHWIHSTNPSTQFHPTNSSRLIRISIWSVKSSHTIYNLTVLPNRSPNTALSRRFFREPTKKRFSLIKNK